ncbi:MAG: hypothetical protein Q9184_004637 [Pyrenodesmia sp. 2 TL-2023]
MQRLVNQLLLESLLEPPSEMSQIGHVLNKALNKQIPVVIAESGDGFKRLTGVIDSAIKNNALAKVKERFENGSMFKDDDMKQMERLQIT